MYRWLGKTAVVTGAASGIGEAITRALLRNGVNVAALDVQEEGLERLVGELKRQPATDGEGKLLAIPCDVTREDEIDRAFSRVQEELGGVDVMVNSAGIVEYTRVIGHTIPEKPLMDVEGCNGWNLYVAGKHATVALTQTVRHELESVKAPIRITSISPGLVKTNLAKNYEVMNDFFDRTPALRPDDVADALIYALGTRPEVEIKEITIQLAAGATVL